MLGLSIGLGLGAGWLLGCLAVAGLRLASRGGLGALGIVGLVLGIGRVLAETAALLFTSGFVDRTPRSLFDSGRTLSIHIYELSMNVAGGEPNAYATAVVLLVLLLTINLIAITVTDRLLKRKVNIF